MKWCLVRQAHFCQSAIRKKVNLYMSVSRVVGLTRFTVMSGQRQAAISHIIFPFHATLSLQPFNLPCQRIRVFRQAAIIFQMIHLVH